MKRLKYILLTILVGSLLQSCSFLEVDNQGTTDTDTFFKDMDGLRIASSGLYYLTYSFYDSQLYKYAEVAGDLITSSVVGSSSDMYYQFNFESEADMETTSVGYIWKNGYNVIINANTILNYTSKLKEAYPNNITEISHIEAQALMTRAMVHFDLVRCYAQPYSYTTSADHLGVPILDKLLGVNEEIGRSSVAKVYSQIIADLMSAKGKFSQEFTSDAHYASADGCSALLSRVYLYMGKYDESAKLASDLISKYSLTQGSSYMSMFVGQQLGDEAIYRLSGYYAGSSLKNFYSYDSPKYIPSKKLKDMIAANDCRRGVVERSINGSPKEACYKYYDFTSASIADQYYNLTIVRLSELYLNRAEALCLTGKLDLAADDLGTIQSRAMGSNQSVSYADADDLFEQIKTERAKELCFEGHRFFDLARWGDDIVRDENSSASTKLLEYPDYRYALPIPTVEIEANSSIEQNNGYSTL